MWWVGTQHNSSLKPSRATVSKVAPAGLPRSEIIGPGQGRTFVLSSGHPGQPTGRDPIPLTPLTKL